MIGIDPKSEDGLAGIELFSDVPGEVLAHLNGQCQWHRLPAGQLLIDGESKEPHGMYVLTDGEVEVFRSDSHGQVAPLGRLTATTCFGEFAAIMGSPGSASVRTRTDCLLAEIPGTALVKLLKDYPSVSLFLLRKAVSLIRELNEDLTRFQAMDSLLATVHCRAILRSL
jgi:CRP-like cAMP-binding protein